jgi:hypothetical protein
MSTSPRPSASLHPTRQQLDDLDDLMQRMLALPMDDALPQEEPGDLKADSGPLLVEDLLHHEDVATARDRSISPRPLQEAPPPPARRLAPAPVLWREEGTRESRSSPSGFPALELPSLAPAATLSAEPANGCDPCAKTSEGFVLLVWTNRAFDLLTMRLGPPGRWLRGARGRSSLGLLGLILLAAALAWGALDWMGLDPLAWVR